MINLAPGRIETGCLTFGLIYFAIDMTLYISSIHVVLESRVPTLHTGIYVRIYTVPQCARAPNLDGLCPVDLTPRANGVGEFSGLSPNKVIPIQSIRRDMSHLRVIFLASAPANQKKNKTEEAGGRVHDFRCDP